MNIYKIEKISQLQQEFPDKNIILLPEADPEEVIAELEHSSEQSIAIALIWISKRHHHTVTVEHYYIEDGILTLHFEDRDITLEAGQSYIIYPPQIHWATGDGARVRVTSTPGWTPEDHILD